MRCVRPSFIWAALTMAATLLLALLASRALVRPIRALVGASTKLAAGDFTVEVPVGSKDELGTLSSAFNSMVATLRDNEDRLRESEAKFRTMYASSGDALMLA